jgi:RNA polymerase sigma-70 factor (ECF subfamily)
LTEEEALAERRRRFERVYEAHAERVLAYALRRVPPDDAREVVSEAFLVAWRRLDEIPGHALPWLLVVARNIILNQQRSGRRRRALGSRLEADLSRRATGGSDPADEVGIRQAVIAALRRLPPIEREALILSAWDKLNHREAALVAGCTPGTFAVRLHRARKRLTKELERTGHFPNDEPEHASTEEVDECEPR